MFEMRKTALQCSIPPGWSGFNSIILGLNRHTLTQRFNGGQRVRNQSLARMRQWVIHYNPSLVLNRSWTGNKE